MAGSAPRSGGLSGVGVPVVVGGVVPAIGLVKLAQAGDRDVQRRRRRQVEDEGTHLRAEEVVGTRGPEGRQARVFRPRQEVEDVVGIGVVPDLRPVGRRESADHWQQRGRGRPPLLRGQRLVPGHDRSEGIGPSVLGEEALRRPDDVERVRLAGLGGLAPGRDPVAAEHGADRLRMVVRDRRDIEAELEARSSPRDPRDAIPEALPGQPLAVGGGGERDPGIRMEVVDMGGVDEAMHRRIDRGRRAPATMEAVVERGDHLVLALDARVDVDEGAQPVQPKHGETTLGQRPEVTAGALDPQEVDRVVR